MRRRSFDLDVSGAGVGGVDSLAADLVVPDEVDGGPLLVCFPGGGMSRRYFDLPAIRPGEWSMAVHLADRFGIAVAVMDHPGVGGSDVPDDPWCLVPSLVADIECLAVRSLLVEFSDWDPSHLVGCGHSMGAMLVTHLQSRQEPFDALALLGYGGFGMADHVSPEAIALAGDVEALEAALPELARARYGVPFRAVSDSRLILTAPDATQDGRAVLASASTEFLTMCGLFTMVPGSSFPLISSIDVPVFIGVGERDIAADVEQSAEKITSSPRIVGFTVPGSGHNHFVSAARAELWNAIGEFVLSVGRREAR